MSTVATRTQEECLKRICSTMTYDQLADEGLIHNAEIVAEIMSDTDATEDEAWDMLDYDCDLDELRKIKKQEAAYDKLLIDLLLGSLEFLRNEYYKGQNVSEEFLLNEAKEMTEEQAYMFVYEWEQYED